MQRCHRLPVVILQVDKEEKRFPVVPPGPPSKREVIQRRARQRNADPLLE